jgi:hypothetical protein
MALQVIVSNYPISVSPIVRFFCRSDQQLGMESGAQVDLAHLGVSSTCRTLVHFMTPTLGFRIRLRPVPVADGYGSRREISG